jgi:hypothetical protein
MLSRNVADRLPCVIGQLSLQKGLHGDEVGPWNDDGAKDDFQLQPLNLTCIMAPRLVDLVLLFPFGSRHNQPFCMQFLSGADVRMRRSY